MIQTASTNGVHNATDEAIDVLYSWMPGTAPASAPCPEATFSLTLKGTLDGVEALLTARGQTAAEFKRNLDAIRGLLDPPAPPEREGEGWCSKHATAMHWNEGKGGRKGWHSHKTAEGQWCKGR